ATQAPDIDGVVALEGEFREGEMVAVRITGAGDYDLAGVRQQPAEPSRVDMGIARP
ncbi:MAG: hypothetical protein ACREQ9_20920, partial [Candidatus Binatia bacterium]